MMPFSNIQAWLRNLWNRRLARGFWAAVTAIAVAWMVHSDTFAFIHIPDSLTAILYGPHSDVQRGIETLGEQIVDRSHKSNSYLSELSQRRLEEAFRQLQPAENGLVLAQIVEQWILAQQRSGKIVSIYPRFRPRYYWAEIVSQTALGYQVRIEKRLCVPVFDWPELCYMPLHNREEIKRRILEP